MLVPVQDRASHVRLTPVPPFPPGRAAPGVVRSWTLWTALLGPLTLLVSWSLADALQPDHFSPVRQSISALAVGSATHPWIVTTGLYVVGGCQLLTAAGMTSMRKGARVFFAAGGVAGLGVAFFPQPEHGPTGSSPHIVFATLCIVSLAVWPWVAGSYGFAHLTPVSNRTVAAATTLFLALVAWVFVAGHGAGALGLAERVDLTVANLWPLVIVVALRRTRAVPT